MGFKTLHFIPAVLLLAGCSRDSDPGPLDYADERVVTVRILDAVTSEPIEGAEAAWIGGEESLTNESGLARVAGPDEGRPEIRVRHEGYAEIQAMLGDEAAVSGTSASWVTTQELHRLGVAFKGSLELPKADDSLTRPAAGVQVELTLPEIFTTRIFHTRTDDRGRYSFTDLPEASSYRISAGSREFPSGTLYLPPRTLPPRVYLSGVEYEMPALAMVPEGTIPFLEVLSTRDAHLAGKAPLQILFSQPVDVKGLPEGWQTLESENGAVNASLAWSMDNTLLTVSPETEDWEAILPCTLALSGLEDIHGGVMEKPVLIRLTAMPALPPVDSLWTGAPVDWTHPYYRLHWTPVANAERYEVYQRNSPSADFKLAYTTESYASIRVSKELPAGKFWIQHKVLPIAKGVASRLSLAKILTVEDLVAPVFSNPGHVVVRMSASGFDNTQGTSPITAILAFDLPLARSEVGAPVEPLDTTAIPDVEPETGMVTNCPNLREDTSKVFWIEKAEFHFTGSNSGEIRAIIPPGKYCPRLSYWLDFTQFRDLAGNLSIGDRGAQFSYSPGCP